MRPVVDLVGRKFGKLTVIRRSDIRDGGSALWVCGCKCGGGKEIRGRALRAGNTKSCGCIKAGMKVGQKGTCRTLAQEMRATTKITIPKAKPGPPVEQALPQEGHGLLVEETRNGIYLPGKPITALKKGDLEARKYLMMAIVTRQRA